MSFLTALKDLTDPRRGQGKRFQMNEIVFISILAILSNAKSYRDIATFIQQKYDWLQMHLNLEWQSIPAYTTIRAILISVDEKELEEILRKHSKEYIYALIMSGVHITLDGKTLRGSYDNAKNELATHLTSAFIPIHNIILAQEEVRRDKTNEIPVLQDLLIPIQGNFSHILFTADALHCQKATIEQVLENQGDILVQVKRNQKGLLEDCKDRIRINRRVDRYRDITKGHGRIEERIVEVYTGLQSYSEWRDIISCVIRVRRIYGKWDPLLKEYDKSTSENFYVSTKTLRAQSANKVIRDHWGIENSNHYVRDVSLGEDSSRIRVRPEVMSKLRSISLNIFRMNGVSNIRRECVKNAYNIDNLLDYEFMWS